jgi:hypothetical protein
MEKIKTKKHISPTKVKTILLGAVIAIVLASFIIYLIQAIYPSPKYEDYCDIETRISLPENKELLGGTCATVSPGSRNECCINKGYEFYNQETGECESSIKINYQECQKQYDLVRNQYRLVVFVVAVIAGLIAVSAGIMIALPSVSSGLMVGGAFLIFYGTAIYWSNLSNWLRAIILGIVLAILIWLGYKKLKN